MSERRNPYLNRSLGYFRHPPVPRGRYIPPQTYAPTYEEESHPWVHVTCILITVAMLAAVVWKWQILSDTISDMLVLVMEDGVHILLIFGSMIMSLSAIARRFNEPEW